jgi:hypothetical protein
MVGRGFHPVGWSTVRPLIFIGNYAVTVGAENLAFGHFSLEHDPRTAGQIGHVAHLQRIGGMVEFECDRVMAIAAPGTAPFQLDVGQKSTLFANLRQGSGNIGGSFFPCFHRVRLPHENKVCNPAQGRLDTYDMMGGEAGEAEEMDSSGGASRWLEGQGKSACGTGGSTGLGAERLPVWGRAAFHRPAAAREGGGFEKAAEKTQLRHKSERWFSERTFILLIHARPSRNNRAISIG